MRTRRTSARAAARALSLAAVATTVAVFGVAGPASAEPVPPPDTAERADTVPILARAAESQGICYGWALADQDTYVNYGSNLGDLVSVDREPQRCPRWVMVVANVGYTADSSESEDWSTIEVLSSPDLDTGGMAAELTRFDLDEKAFIAEPGWAICRAATMLPLLVAERGLASPAPVATAEPTASVSPLAAAGSDMWRDRWGYFAGAAGLLLTTALLVTLGLVQRRGEYNREVERKRRLAARREREQRAGKAKPGGGRTREEG